MINREDRSQGEEKMEKRDNSKLHYPSCFLTYSLRKYNSGQLSADRLWSMWMSLRNLHEGTRQAGSAIFISSEASEHQIDIPISS